MGKVPAEEEFQPGHSSNQGMIPARAEFQLEQGSSGAKFQPG